MAEEPGVGTAVRIGNFSGFYGDRLDSIGELLDAGVDYLTGDYLAELTMLILRKNQLAGRPGYAAGFIGQLRPVLPRIAQQKVKLVCNAGGLDPQGCAHAVRSLCDELGVSLVVAAITGDNVLAELPDLVNAQPGLLRNLDNGQAFEVPADDVLAANAYLGAWPIVEALRAGADIVICPRVTDASLVIAPAAFHHNWAPDDFNELAGALWAGHAIECGGQVTGGNYSFFFEEGPLGVPPMPIGEIYSDGTSVITKASAAAGRVTVDSVKAQLLYEVSGPLYHNPDVIGDLRTVEVSEVGHNAVRIANAVGYAPTDTAKLSICYDGGYRNTITIGVTGARVDRKLEWLRAQVDEVLTGEAEFESYRWTVIGPRDPHGATLADSTAWVVITARSSNAHAVGRRSFSSAITQLGVSSIPGLYFAGPPQSEKSAAVQWPCLIAKERVNASVHVGDTRALEVNWPVLQQQPANAHGAFTAVEPAIGFPIEDTEFVKVMLGDHFGTRSGDKAGLANVGVWARDAAAYAWLVDYLDVDRFKALVPECVTLDVDRHLIPGISGINFVIHDWLEMGAASSTHIDNQAKGLGEFLGARRITVPAHLVGAHTAEDSQAREPEIVRASAITG